MSNTIPLKYQALATGGGWTTPQAGSTSGKIRIRYRGPPKIHWFSGGHRACNASRTERLTTKGGNVTCDRCKQTRHYKEVCTQWFLMKQQVEEAIGRMMNDFSPLLPPPEVWQDALDPTILHYRLTLPIAPTNIMPFNYTFSVP